MCGLAGFFAPDTGADADALARVAEAMSLRVCHRGPDDGGTWVDAGQGIALGHRRLSIIDLSAEGHQPMRSADERFVLVFNGEIYNFRILGAELAARGHSFRGHSDTEVLLAGFREWGVRGTVERLVGMFAFALWDRGERALHLCRDRLGEKPLYYGWTGGAFVFGSELKSLRAHPRWHGEVDRGALTLFLRYGYVPAPYSIYRGIRKLEPGHLLSVTAEDVARGSPGTPSTPYWSLAGAVARGVADPFGGSDREAVDSLESLLGDAITQQMVSDVPLGAFLSGGVDSSTVVALMQAHSSKPVRTFSIGFRQAGYNEAEHAAAVAHHLGTEHTELYVSAEEAMAVIPRLPEIYDEPFADSSQIPTYLVAELASRSVTVSLSGDAGDELFGGYNRYLWAPSIWAKLGPVPRPLRSAAAAALRAASPAAWDRAFAALAPVLPGRLRQPRSGEKLEKLTGILDAAHPDEIYRRLVSQVADPAGLAVGGAEPGGRDAIPAGGPTGFAERMMYADALTYLPDDILVKVDRAAMAVSLETRVPFLDHRVVEFAWRLPAHLKMRRGTGKWILREVLYRHVPRSLIERPKMGFAIPVGEWLRGPLRAWAESLLNADRLRSEGYLNAGAVARLWREHLAGRRDHTAGLWNLLMFQSWLAHCTDDAPARGKHAPPAQELP